MKKYALTFIYFFLSYFSCLCQDSHISGVVTVGEEKTPIKYANVYLAKSKNGSITNADGKFKILLFPGINEDTLIVSSIGYKPKRILVLKDQFVSIDLVESPYEIPEVLIMPDSSIYTLLKKAYNKIESNYPQKRTLLKGFYRESLFNDNDEYLYLSESTLEYVKSKYKKALKNELGQLKVLKVRNFKSPELDSFTTVNFFGGPFLPGEADFVKWRAPIINPASSRKFDYHLIGIKEFEGKKVYEISFRLKFKAKKEEKKRITGKMYILIDSLAFIGFDYKELKLGGDYLSKGGLLTPDFEVVQNEVEVRYFFNNGNWNIKYISLNGKGKTISIDEDIHYENVFVTTSIDDFNIKPIPYYERFRNRGIIVNLEDSLDSGFFKDFTILEQDSLLKDGSTILFDPKESQEIFANDIDKLKSSVIQSKNHIQTIRKIFKKIRFTYSISANSISTNFEEANLMFNQLSPGNSIDIQTESFAQNYLWEWQLEYSLNNRLSIFYSTGSDRRDKLYSQSESAGIYYTFLVKPIGRPFFGEPVLSVTDIKLGASTGRIENPESFEFDGKSFNSDMIEMALGRREYNLKIGGRFRYHLMDLGYSNCWINLSISHSFNLANHQIAVFRESSGNLFNREKAVFQLPQSGLNVSYSGLGEDQQNMTLGSFQGRLGLTISF